MRQRPARALLGKALVAGALAADALIFAGKDLRAWLVAALCFVGVAVGDVISSRYRRRRLRRAPRGTA